MAKTSLGAAARKTVDTIHPIEAAPTSDPPPAPAPPSRPRRERAKPPAATPKWEDANRRTNVWMPVGFPERIRDELVSRGDTRTMSALVVDLLNDWADQ